MKKMTAGIIGGTNGMGRWLADLLMKEGCRVHVIGRKTQMTAEDAAQICDVVVVSVPIAATAEMIARVGPLLKKDQLLMDLTSLKKEPMALMLAHSVSEVVGCHPLFGPQVADAKNQNIVLCPGRGEAGYAWLKNIFDKNGYSLVERTPDEHDRMMAIVQVLNHLNTVALGLAIAETGLSRAEVDSFSTPVFRSKMDIVEKVFTESPELYADIIARNPDTEAMFNIYERMIIQMRGLICSGDGVNLKEAMEAAAKKLF
jgi:prephenate dehydrogenase